MSAKIVHLRETGGMDREEIMNVVRDELYQYDVKTLSRKTGLSTSTLYAVRGGRTEWPRPHTLWTLMAELRLELVIRKRNR